MTGRRLSAVAASLAVAALLGHGCSAIVGPRPPERPLRAADGCSANRGPFYVDALGAGAAAGTAGLMFGVLGLEYLFGANGLTQSWDPHSTAPSNTGTLTTIGAAATAATVVLFLSARYGLQNAKQCDAARLELMQADRQRPPPAPVDVAVERAR